MLSDFQVSGANKNALFTLKLHRGDGMALIAMNWKKGTPPNDFVGFAIEYKEPGGDKFFAVKNRLCFPGPNGEVIPNGNSSRLSPIQKFRWVHFPRNAEMEGEFLYRVTPVFMNDKDELSYGDSQEAALELQRETYPGQLNVAFTRGFVSSQAFVDRYGADSLPTLLPPGADEGLDFKPTFKKADEALAWMGFEARSAIIEVLDQAIADTKAKVFAAVYDLNEPGMVSRFLKLAKRLEILIDDSGTHGKSDSAESTAAERLKKAGADVLRQHMGGLQHNKMVVVDGPKAQLAICGSTNHSWRGFFVQNNNAIIMRGKEAVTLFRTAFENYKANSNDAGAFGKTDSQRNDTAPIARRAMLAFLTPLVLVPAFAIATWQSGPLAGLVHTAYLLALSLSLIEVLLTGYRKLPVTCPMPGFKDNFLMLCLIQFLGFLVFTRAGAAAEAWMFAAPWRFAFVPAAMWAVWRWNRKRLAEAREAGELEEGLTFENPVVRAVTRLDLSS